MIKFYTRFSADTEVDKTVKSFINSRLTEVVNDIMLDFTADADSFVADTYFPSDMRKEYIPTALQDLSKVLSSDEEQVPDILGEYVINSAVNYYTELNEEMGEDEFPINEEIGNRDYIQNKLLSPRELDFAYINFRINEFLSSCDTEDKSSTLKLVENLKYYTEFIFCDTDYEMLDNFSIKELSKACKVMGIDLPEYCKEGVKIG